MAQNETKKIQIILDGKQATATIKDMESAAAVLNAQLKKLPANSKEFADKSKELSQVKGRLKEIKDEVNGVGGVFGKLGQQAKGLAAPLAAVFAVGSIVSFGKEVIDTLAKFQKLEAVLTNTLGSSSEAQKSLIMIRDLAAETPFAVDELTESYVKLVNQGFKPTRGEIIKLGDLAASTGKTFDQLTEAVIDAQVGENERLKEFGIRAKKEGDKVTYTFKGVSTTINNTSAEIQKYLLSLGDAKGVTGAMGAISETVGGQISNLGDNFDQLKLAIGDSKKGFLSGAISALNEFVSITVQVLKGMDAIKKEASMKVMAEQEVKAVAQFDETVKKYIENGYTRAEAEQKYVDILKEQLKISMERTWNNEKASIKEVEIRTNELNAVKKIIEERNKQSTKETEIHAKKTKEANDFEKLMEGFFKFEMQRYQEQLTTNEKEVIAVRNKYAALIEERKKFLADPTISAEQKTEITAQVNVLQNQEKADVDIVTQKQAKATKDFILGLQEELTKELNTEYDNRVTDIKAHYAKLRDESIKKGDFDKTQIAIEKAEVEALNKAKTDREQAGLDTINDLRNQQIVKNRQAESQEYLAIVDKYSNEMAVLRERYGDEYYLNEEFQAQAAELEKLSEEERADYILTQRKELQEQLKQLELDALKFGIDLMQQKLAAYYDAELKGLEQRKQILLSDVEQERNRLNGVVDTRTAADKRADKQKELIEKQAAKREHELKVKAFRAEQMFAVGKIALDTAIAVAKLQGIAAVQLAGAITAPLAANTYTQMGITIGAAALQTAGVLAQKPPQMGKGGILKGDKHSDKSGGMPIIDPSTGTVQALVEGGEAVISADTVSANPNTIQSLLNANGKPIGLFNKPSFADTSRLFSNVASYGAGGVLPSATINTGSNGSTEILQAAELIVSASLKITEAVDVLVKTPIEAQISYTELKKKIMEAREAKRGGLAKLTPDGHSIAGQVYINLDGIL